jgi:membrane-associated phospholipid phosphatase
MQNGRRWGEDAFSAPDLERISQSAYRALLDWKTLAPAAGALLFQIDHFDRRVVDWAVDHRPIFGSGDTARSASDYLYVAFYLETLGTALATPSGENREDWVDAKIRGLWVEGSALAINGLTTVALRNAVHRTTPDGANNYSFPSGHASGAVGAVTLSHRNLAAIPVSDGVKNSIQAGNLFLLTAMSWARLEEGRHFPSDILFGAALGHFFSAFFYDAFMGLPEGQRFGISLNPRQGGFMGQIFFSF